MKRLEGKTALVTGAGSGIGRATAIRFAKEGAKVVLATRTASHGEETLGEIEAAGGTALFVQADGRRKDEVLALVKEARSELGSLDILVNAAGVLVHKPFLEHTDEDFALVSETNFLAYVWAMQTAIPIMREQGGGSIVNVASISTARPELNAYYYGAFKAAIANLSVNVAKEFAAERIRVNVVCPGPVATAMTPPQLQDPEVLKAFVEYWNPIGRIGEPDDVANVILLLASDEAAWITGSSYTVDGGACLAG
ncbi:MAG: SDR family oxidoreductase [Coriobacteriales bacterium]|jgi:NAD(P)-dependent dehydrogenase (short-subunit alcohol dehydrogenase family)|nr:SDR family oxidoreductase [Coriobacteriales bacterium]